ncbi:uncharacterized protein PG998_007098 [Apiospora kogelbergensis]|uniref:uncharacterized protein n=1 Tax=Apiospora kogelbergensis TaxID=1337665 RepID=UPI00312E5132
MSALQLELAQYRVGCLLQAFGTVSKQTLSNLVNLVGVEARNRKELAPEGGTGTFAIDHHVKIVRDVALHGFDEKFRLSYLLAQLIPGLVVQKIHLVQQPAHVPDSLVWCSRRVICTEAFEACKQQLGVADRARAEKRLDRVDPIRRRLGPGKLHEGIHDLTWSRVILVRDQLENDGEILKLGAVAKLAKIELVQAALGHLNGHIFEQIPSMLPFMCLIVCCFVEISQKVGKKV